MALQEGDRECVIVLNSSGKIRYIKYCFRSTLGNLKELQCFSQQTQTEFKLHQNTLDKESLDLSTYKINQQTINCQC